MKQCTSYATRTQVFVGADVLMRWQVGDDTLCPMIGASDSIGVHADTPAACGRSRSAVRPKRRAPLLGRCDTSDPSTRTEVSVPTASSRVAKQLHAPRRGADSELFFGCANENRQIRRARERQAKALCAECPVQPARPRSRTRCGRTIRHLGRSQHTRPQCVHHRHSDREFRDLAPLRCNCRRKARRSRRTCRGNNVCACSCTSIPTD